MKKMLAKYASSAITLVAVTVVSAFSPWFTKADEVPQELRK